MLGKKPNKVYYPFLKARLGYQNPERLKKAIATQPKMYDGERIHSTKFKIDSPNSEETLEDAKESRLKMKDKMIQLDYEKLNALYDTFVIQIVLWIVDSECSKHMTGNLKLLRNFIEKIMGTIRFRNENFAAITGYGDYVQGNLIICHVHYVEGLGYNLFSVGQFCNGDLEVGVRSNTCYVQNLEGAYLLTGSRDSNLSTISISEMAASSLVCLMSKATSTKSWLWHKRLSHLNFGTINHLTKQDLVDGLLKFKYDKDHLCYAC
ncbi:integrase, catalytic region, zinc finger, CCHC-type containing protein [Tanacetum coccineum]